MSENQTGNENEGAAEALDQEDVKFTFLNNDGGSGFAEQKTTTGKMTISDFLEEENVDAGRFQIRVRTKAADGSKQTLTPTADYQIKAGDFITAVPIKAGGAR